ncbi:hypothetical protein [Lacticaseibacillus mingshuiensis]|uniref:hypothetical protein n=1 Tax=Lacticaseibacillus mingshuiensis TaxID=2799574 RepID=UPI00194EA4A5|nr:hypothetical protein [Lacticaseibacillus mingshuiensis]
MKKTILLAVAATVIVTLTGCQQNDNGLASTKSQLTSALTDKNYQQAWGLSQAVQNADNSAKNKARTTQLKHFVAAETAIAQEAFDTAKEQLNAVVATKNGNTKLSVQATSRLKTVKSYQDNIAIANKTLTNAEAALTQDTTALTKARDALATLKKAPYTTAPYQTLYSQILSLDTKLADAQTTAQANASSSTTTNGTSDSQSGTTTAATDQKSGSTSTSDITAADITAARQQIRALGENPVYFSDNDVRAVIQHMRIAGRTTIIKDDLP